MIVVLEWSQNDVMRVTAGFDAGNELAMASIFEVVEVMFDKLRIEGHRVCVVKDMKISMQFDGELMVAYIGPGRWLYHKSQSKTKRKGRGSIHAAPSFGEKGERVAFHIESGDAEHAAGHRPPSVTL